MKKGLFYSYVALGAILLLGACTAAKEGSATKSEALTMKIKENHNLLQIAALKEQSAPTMAMRSEGATRGLPMAGIAGNLISLATDAVKNMIANDQKKYATSYAFGLNDMYFYDQLSSEGAFDPTGMQFQGFKLIRTFKNKEGNTDTAFIADIELDTANAYEILNNSIFRLKLKKLDLRYAKVKVMNGKQKKLNMDIEINFQSSYVNEQGMLFDNVTLGKFILLIRDAPLDKTDANYEDYYKKLIGKKLSGRSFIVPRSLGYRKENGQAVKTFSQGAYSIQVNVKESSKNTFANKLILDNANTLIDAGSKELKILSNKLPQ